MAERVNGLSDDLRETKDAVNGLRGDLRGIVGNPMQEARERRTALFVAVVAALAGGGVTAVVTAISGGFGH